MAIDSSAATPRDLMTPAVLHMLLALADGALHGYGIKQNVEERTNGALSLGPGTLYEGVHRLERTGWIEETDPADGADGRRRYYRLTVAGRRAMEDELGRLDEIVRYARARDLMPEVGS
jgi:DNA-binding PadR family transcriptional regulator